MTAPRAAALPASKPPPPGGMRLILRSGTLSLAEHLDSYGPPPADSSRTAARLIDEVDRAGLTGRGGGAFPAARKMRAVALAARRRPAVVVANACESEPASNKDLVLLSHAPHLVLDGITVAARAVGANEAYLCLGQQTAQVERALAQAIAERERAGLDTVPVRVICIADGYLSGQETALIAALNGGPPLPSFVPPRPSDRGAHRRPTLVQNVETLAHLALIARYGSDWFRQVGTAAAPGSALVTVAGAVQRPGVREIPFGTPLGEVLTRCGLDQRPQAVLAGGYFGTWLPLPAAMTAPLSREGLRPLGAALGSGVLAVLPETACGLAETARVLSYLASQNARQCGPCINGLPALAQAMNWLAFGQPSADWVTWTGQLTQLITGRGACHLPDGAAALATSALSVFAADLRAHASGGPCPGAALPPALPIPPAREHR